MNTRSSQQGIGCILYDNIVKINITMVALSIEMIPFSLLPGSGKPVLKPTLELLIQFNVPVELN